MTDPGPARRDPALLVALGSSLALAATLLLFPSAPWRIPLALLGGIWAPGYALLGAAYPRGALTTLERHALAATAGLCLLPLLSLLASETVGLRSARVALVALAVTLAFAALATWRAARSARAGRAAGEGGAREMLVRSALPSTKVTIAICVGALALAALVEAGSALTAQPTPPSLAMGMAGGPMDLDLQEDEASTLVLTMSAGAKARQGDLVVSRDGVEVHREAVALDAGGSRAVEIALPTTEAGSFELRAWWLWLSVDATFHVEGAWAEDA